jgi:hypothetical protein
MVRISEAITPVSYMPSQRTKKEHCSFYLYICNLFAVDSTSDVDTYTPGWGKRLASCHARCVPRKKDILLNGHETKAGCCAEKNKTGNVHIT